MIRIEGNNALIDSAQDKVIIEAVKSDIPGRRWLGNPPLWRAEITSSAVVEALIALAERFEMIVPEDFAATLRARFPGAVATVPQSAIDLDESGNRIVVRADLTPGLYAAMEKVQAASFNKAANAWYLPLTNHSWAALRPIAEKLSLTLSRDLEEKVNTLFADTMQAYREAVALKPTGRITEIPGMADVPNKPFAPAQWAAVEYGVDFHTGCLIFDEPGVAKTSQSMAALAYLRRRRILWICPSIGKMKMVGEALERFPDWTSAIIEGRSAKGWKKAFDVVKDAETAMLVINYEILAAHIDAILDWNPDGLVCDESHRLKEAETSWTRAITGEGARLTNGTVTSLSRRGLQRMMMIAPAGELDKVEMQASKGFPKWQISMIRDSARSSWDRAMSSIDDDHPIFLILDQACMSAHDDAIHQWGPQVLIANSADDIMDTESSWVKEQAGRSLRRKKTKQGSKAILFPGKLGLADQVRSIDGSVLLLSGTPAPSGPWELITQLQIADRLDALGGWQHFARRYCGARQVNVGGRRVWEMKQRLNLDELNVMLRQNGMLRRKLRDVCPELIILPPEFVDVDLDPVYFAEYKEAEANIAEYSARKAAELARQLGLNPQSAAVKARLKVEMARDGIELTTLRRLIGMAKLPGAIAWAKEFLELNASTAMAEFDGEEAPTPAKLAVAGYHHDVVQALYEALGGVSIRGTDTPRARDKAKDIFQSDPDVRVITCSILAAGEAIELHAAHTTLTVEYDWVPKTHIQWVGRLYRRGQKGQVRPVYVHAKNTTDDVQKGVLETKGAASDRMIDGTGAGGQSEFVDIEQRMLDALIAIGMSRQEAV